MSIDHQMRDENFVLPESITNEEKTDNGIINPPKFGKRHLHVILLFFGLAISFSHGSALTVAIVAMVNNTANPSFEEIHWTEQQRGVIFSSPFWAFFVASLLSGIVAQRFGAKMPLLLVMLFKSILVTLTPQIAGIGFGYMVTKQVIDGLLGGFVFPCAHTLMGKWYHPSERGILAPTTLSGSIIGSILTLSISGVIITSSIGWPGIFYVTGGAGILWSILWFFFGGSSPSSYRYITTAELYYLENMPGAEIFRKPIPWKHILLSPPVWALVVSQCGESWGFVMLQAWVPTYIDGVLHYNIESNSIISASIFLVMFVIIHLCGHLSNFLNTRQYISLQFSRKLFNTIGTWGPAIGLVALGFVHNNTLAITLLIISVGINAATHSGFVINHLDIAPNFAGTLVGMCIAIGNIMSILSPLFAGYIITDTSDARLWQIVFGVTAVVFFVSNSIFIIFGKTNIQNWN